MLNRPRRPNAGAVHHQTWRVGQYDGEEFENGIFDVIGNGLRWGIDGIAKMASWVREAGVVLGSSTVCNKGVLLLCLLLI